MSETLSLKINNTKPIELNSLTNSLNALAKEYDTFTKCEFGLAKTNRKLEIKKLEQGSLIIELVAIAIPQMQEINTIIAFGKHLINGLDYFVGRKRIDNPSFSKTTVSNLGNFVDTIANDSNSSLSIQIVGNGNNLYVGGDYSSVDCNALQNNINKYQKSLDEEEPSLVQHKQAFYWFSASFANKSISNISSNVDKGIIEKFDLRPHKIIFENDADKALITSSNSKFKKDWQELMYIVDVEIVKIQGVIKMYKILRVYYDDTFDPAEDN